MRRGFVLAAAVTSVLLGALPAQAVAQVTIADFSFSPTPLTVAQGTSVVWHNNGPHTHTSTVDGTLGLWDTGDLATGATSSAVVFQAGGVYPYHCKIHPSMHGMIRVPILITPSTGTLATTFTITLAAASQSGYTFDVQKKHGAALWKTWKTGVSTLTVTFKPNVTGTFRFRSRLHKTSNGATSSWSLAKMITVS
jgi:plastocyanin